MPNDERALRAISRLSNFIDLTPNEIDWLRSVAGENITVPRGRSVWSEASHRGSHNLILLREGWAINTETLDDGSRPITNIYLAGDLLGTPGLSVETPFDSVIALSEVTVSALDPDLLRRLFVEQPRIAAAVYMVAQEERMLAMERLSHMGGTQAKRRLAIFLVRLIEKLQGLWPDADREYEFLMTQQDIADYIGVTVAHANTVIGELRASGLIEISQRKLRVLDENSLAEYANVLRWKRSKLKWLPTAA